MKPPYLHWHNAILHCEQVALDRIAAQFGTPCYVYSLGMLQATYRELQDAFFETGLDARIHYAVKANSNIQVLRALADEGAGADIVSAGEMQRALYAGIKADRIIFSGVGKSDEELRLALEKQIGQINIESSEEFEALAALAETSQRLVRIAIRLNPDIDAGTHEKISTGKQENKFGVNFDEALALYKRALDCDFLDADCIAMHIGSQITNPEPWIRAGSKMRELYTACTHQGNQIKKLDVGGGLGVQYHDGMDALQPADWAGAIKQSLGDLPVQFLLEPGRFVVADSGLLLTRCLRCKSNRTRHFIILDAAMNDLLRPALYDSHHELLPIHQPGDEAKQASFDLVGPICESSDLFARKRRMTSLKKGDLAAFTKAGAYGAVMASEYNARPLVPEIVIRKNRFALARPRGDIMRAIQTESAVEWHDGS
ncbi:MAG: diaminopimelate decarboxylase [Pseudomonadota bacterium]